VDDRLLPSATTRRSSELQIFCREVPSFSVRGRPRLDHFRRVHEVSECLSLHCLGLHCAFDQGRDLIFGDRTSLSSELRSYAQPPRLAVRDLSKSNSLLNPLSPFFGGRALRGIPLPDRLKGRGESDFVLHQRIGFRLRSLVQFARRILRG